MVETESNNIDSNLQSNEPNTNVSQKAGMESSSFENPLVDALPKLQGSLKEINKPKSYPNISEELIERFFQILPEDINDQIRNGSLVSEQEVDERNSAAIMNFPDFWEKLYGNILVSADKAKNMNVCQIDKEDIELRLV